MNNPIRRNRSIGTPKQGHGQNNHLTIPSPCGVLKDFYERLKRYQKVSRTINGHDFLFIIEETRTTSSHACSVEDLDTIIQHVRREDYGDLKFIVLRQPKRKEETLAPVWGRLIYSYESEGSYFPAIILEAVDFTRRFKWPKNLSVDGQKEIARLKEDGHEIIDDGKNLVAEYQLENVRNTQLYRTLLHEFGHYVHYMEVVERQETIGENFNAYEKRMDQFFTIPKLEREAYAHRYADILKKDLVRRGIVPFDRKLEVHDQFTIAY